MTVDYKQLKIFVKEAMFTGGGINEPSAPEGIPHRMPSADTTDREQHMGDEHANKMYAVALVAREAAEELVVALDDPVYDNAYEHAFKASACLRRALNEIETMGAHPMPDQRVVAPPRNQQKYNAGAGDYAGGPQTGDFGGGGQAWIQEAGRPPEIPKTETHVGERALTALNAVTDKSDIIAITAWLTAHPSYTAITGG